MFKKFFKKKKEVSSTNNINNNNSNNANNVNCNDTNNANIANNTNNLSKTLASGAFDVCPEEVIFSIFKFLSPTELVAASLSCKRLEIIANHKLLPLYDFRICYQYARADKLKKESLAKLGQKIRTKLSQMKTIETEIFNALGEIPDHIKKSGSGGLTFIQGGIVDSTDLVRILSLIIARVQALLNAWESDHRTISNLLKTKQNLLDQMPQDITNKLPLDAFNGLLQCRNIAKLNAEKINILDTQLLEGNRFSLLSPKSLEPLLAQITLDRGIAYWRKELPGILMNYRQILGLKIYDRLADGYERLITGYLDTNNENVYTKQLFDLIESHAEKFPEFATIVKNYFKLKADAQQIDPPKPPL